MLSLRWRSHARLVAVVMNILALSWACSPARQGYFQPQTNAVSRFTSSVAEPVVTTDTIPTVNDRSGRYEPLPVVTEHDTTKNNLLKSSSFAASQTSAAQFRHRNPESRPLTRFRRLFSTQPIAHVAPRRQTTLDQHSPARKNHPLAWVALGFAGLAYIPVLLAGAGTLAWVLSLTLPLTAVLLGVASLTTINRNKDRFRGKGWAMAAVLLGTGVLGLALVALAALSVSNVVWEKK